MQHTNIDGFELFEGKLMRVLNSDCFGYWRFHDNGKPHPLSTDYDKIARDPNRRWARPLDHEGQLVEALAHYPAK